MRELKNSEMRFSHLGSVSLFRKQGVKAVIYAIKVMTRSSFRKTLFTC